MNTPEPLAIGLADLPPTDAFSLQIALDGVELAHTVASPGPGIFKGASRDAYAGLMLHEGSILGFLQRGPLLMPVLMPHDGWLLSAANEGLKAEHGTPLCRIIRATGAIVP